MNGTLYACTASDEVGRGSSAIRSEPSPKAGRRECCGLCSGEPRPGGRRRAMFRSSTGFGGDDRDQRDAKKNGPLSRGPSGQGCSPWRGVHQRYLGGSPLSRGGTVRVRVPRTSTASISTTASKTSTAEST